MTLGEFADSALSLSLIEVMPYVAATICLGLFVYLVGYLLVIHGLMPPRKLKGEEEGRQRFLGFFTVIEQTFKTMGAVSDVRYVLPSDTDNTGEATGFQLCLAAVDEKRYAFLILYSPAWATLVVTLHEKLELSPITPVFEKRLAADHLGLVSQAWLDQTLTEVETAFDAIYSR